MGGKKRKASNLQASFRSFESVKEHENYIRLAHSMIDSQSWQDLNHTSRTLYTELKRRYDGGNGQDIKLTYGYLVKRKLIDRKSIAGCMNDLIKHGFIKIITEGRQARQCNVYGLHDGWKTFPRNEYKLLTPAGPGKQKKAAAASAMETAAASISAVPFFPVNGSGFVQFEADNRSVTGSITIKGGE